MATHRYRLAIERRLLITRAAVQGPRGYYSVRLLVDTGSQFTFIAWEVLEAVGFVPGAQREHRAYVSTTGAASVPLVTLDRFSCLGRAVTQFPILSYTLPLARYVNGLLGTDFMHRFPFKIDTQRGVIESYDPRMSRRARAS